MLLETLGQVTKRVVLNAPGDSVCDGLQVRLGLEMWAGVRYAFWTNKKLNPRGDFDQAKVDVYPWGLFIDESINEQVYNGAMEQWSNGAIWRELTWLHLLTAQSCRWS